MQYPPPPPVPSDVDPATLAAYPLEELARRATFCDDGLVATLARCPAAHRSLN